MKVVVILYSLVSNYKSLGHFCFIHVAMYLDSKMNEPKSQKRLIIWIGRGIMDVNTLYVTLAKLVSIDFLKNENYSNKKKYENENYIVLWTKGIPK